jgi:hypothetical protein
MRIVVSEFISLDGSVEEPGGAEGYEQSRPSAAQH